MEGGGALENRSIAASPFLSGLAASFLLDLRPLITQGDRAIEDQLPGAGILINHEVSQALKLKTITDSGRPYRRLDVNRIQDAQRVGIDEFGEIFFLVSFGRFNREEIVIEPRLGGYGVPGGNPVQGRLYPPSIGRRSATCRRIVGAAQLDDLSPCSSFMTSVQVMK